MDKTDQAGTYNWKDIFRSLGFVTTERGGMIGRVEDIAVTAIEHPLMGVSVTATHNDGRTATQFENFLPEEVSIQDVGKFFLHIIAQIHPEMVKKPEPCSPPARERKRPSQAEALRMVPELLRQLFGVVDELEFLFQRPFTPDGHMVGSIGEAVAAVVYDLDLLHCSSETHDARSKDGRMVQVKLTFGKKGVSIYGEPEHLIVLQLAGRQQFVEIYNGLGSKVWPHAGRLQKNGQRSISLTRLRGIQRTLPLSEAIPQVRDLSTLMDGGAEAVGV